MHTILAIIRSHRSLLVDADTSNTRANEIYESARNFIDGHYLEDISIDTISKSIAVSPFHMSRVFKEKSGCSPMQYATRLRLGKAQTLLVHKDMTVTDIAYNVGYNSSSAFNYSFQKQFGITPLTFRDLYR